MKKRSRKAVQSNPPLLKMPNETDEQFAKRKAEIEAERKEQAKKRVGITWLGKNKSN
jgi:hypothetical protein